MDSSTILAVFDLGSSSDAFVSTKGATVDLALFHVTGTLAPFSLDCHNFFKYFCLELSSPFQPDTPCW